MGTRGYYVYKWRGRYYIYYNHWDSYPSGLGRVFTSNIPTDPEEFRRWLEKRRAEYTELERRLFTVTLDRARTGNLHKFSEIGVEGLHKWPTYSMPHLDHFIEWIYIIDLDDCQFGVNNLDDPYDLANIPEDWHLDEKFDHGSEDEYSDTSNTADGDLVKETEEGNANFGDLSIANLSSDEPEYLALSPKIVTPRHTSRLNMKPAFFISKVIFQAVLQQFPDGVENFALDNIDHTFLVRESIFACMSLASCSPELVRVSTKACVLEGGTKKIALMNVDGQSSSVTSTSTEFVSALYKGYHLTENPPGSSPATPYYWLQNVLIFPVKDLEDTRRFQQSIVDVVNYGRASGKSHFDAIVVSLAQAAPVWVGGDHVQHTKPLGFESDSTFDALAHVFEAAALRQLSPTSSRSLGVFPNEIYRLIVERADTLSRVNCSKVSRAFRDFASSEFTMTDGLSLRLDSEGQPMLYHATQGPVSPKGTLNFYTLEKRDRRKTSTESYQWHPIIGECNDTASYLHRTLLKFDEHFPRTTNLDLTCIDPQPHYFNQGQLDREKIQQDIQLQQDSRDRRIQNMRVNLEQDSQYSNNKKTEESFFGSPSQHYAAFERHVPSRDIIVGACDMIGVYTYAFFRPLNILYGWNPQKDMFDIPKMPINTYFTRCYATSTPHRLASCQAMYGLIWSLQSNETSEDVWANARQQAFLRASEAYLDALYVLWMWEQDYHKIDFVLMIIIGTKFLTFTRSNVCTIPPVTDFPEIYDTGDEKEHLRFHRPTHGFDLWEEAGIDHRTISESVRWESLDGNEQPVDVLNIDDRPRIAQIFGRVREISTQWICPWDFKE